MDSLGEMGEKRDGRFLYCRMQTWHRTQTFTVNESAASNSNQATGPANTRNLLKNHLGGVIFGCKNSTIKECLLKQLFGLPAQHFSYVKNIDPGLPLFLFNYSDRTLHGIFEAASSGQMNINSYAWTTDGSERTPFPAQVQVHIRMQCQALPENQFKPIIVDNYYTQNHFWFELDHAQTSRLMSLLSSLAVAPSTTAPQNTAKWRTLIQALPIPALREENDGFDPPALEVDFSHSYKSNGKLGTSDVTSCLDDNHQPLEDCSSKQVMEQDEKDLIYMKLKEIALKRERSDSSSSEHVEDSALVNHVNLEHKGFTEEQTISEEKNEEISVNSSDYPSVIAQLVQGVEELKAFKTEQIHKMDCLKQKLVEAETEIRQLKDRCTILESMSNPSVARVNETVIESSDEHCLDLDDLMLDSMSNPSVAHFNETVTESLNELHLDHDDLIYLVGGYDGKSYLSALDLYSPSTDVIKSLQPMRSVRAHSSVAKLNGELYVFGGGIGSLWCDTVESYDIANNQWTMRPSLSGKKGSLAGATLNDKIFALGGGDGIVSFSDVEMLDLNIGRWISTQSMLHKRFALAAAELNGVLYAVGGYDGKDYLKSAERFDPREHSWTRIASMETERGSHSLAVMNEKLYVLGGFDGSTMVPSIEVYDPRLGSWMIGEPMNQSRGYSVAAVLKESLYVIGGIKNCDEIVDTVECYKEGQKWQVTNLRGIGRRCFFSAIV